MRRALALLPILALTACGGAVGTWTQVDPVHRALGIALESLDAAPGVRVAGTTRTGAAVDLRVTGAGEATGTVQRGGRRADVLVVDGKTYVRGSKEYWGSLDERAEMFAGSWVEADDSVVGFPVQETLAPAALAKGLQERFGEAQGVQVGPPSESTIGGVRAWRSSTPGGEVYVSADEPHRVLRVDAPLAAGGAESDRVRLDVTTESEDGAADVLSAVGLGAGQLAKSGAYDLGVRISLVGALKAPCGAAGCAVSATVKNDSAEATVNVVLQVRVTSGPAQVAACASGAKPIAPAKTASLGCQAGGAKWASFYQRATRPSSAPRTTPYLVRAVALARAVPPASATCSVEASVAGGAKPPTSCPKPAITEDGFDHSFKHAKDWWGRTPTAADRAEWRRMVETALGSGKRFPWSSGATPTTGHLARIGGRYFVAQFDRETGALVTAFGPNPGQLRAMLKLLGQ